MKTEIIITEDGGLKREVWTFYFMDNRMILYVDSYSIETRETTRHRFKPIQHYSRLDERRSTLKVSEVPLTETIKAMAIANFTKSLQVKLWDK